MGRIIALLFLLGGCAAAQQLVRVDPDCPVGGAGFMFSTAGQTGPGPTGFFDNRQAGCSNWTVTYSQVAAGALQIEIQGAENVGGAPGPWTTFTGTGITIIQGSNPSTTTPSGIIQVAGYKPFMRVISDSQTAFIVGFLFGARNSAAAGAAPVTGGCAGTVATPCVVDGPDAAGAVPTKSPVLVAGFDGTDVRRIFTDATGQVINDPLGAATAQADGATNSPTIPFANGVAAAIPVYPKLFNGATWDRQFISINQVRVNVSAGTAQKLVAQVSAKTTLITHISFAMSAAADASIVQGTTVSTPCDTTQVVLAGPYKAVTAIALDFSPASALRNTTTNVDTCLIFSASLTAGGVAVYAQF